MRLLPGVPVACAPVVPQISKNRCDARIISSSSFLTKPSYGTFPRGVLVGLSPKPGRESTEKSSNYDTAYVMNRPYSRDMAKGAFTSGGGQKIEDY